MRMLRLGTWIFCLVVLLSRAMMIAQSSLPERRVSVLRVRIVSSARGKPAPVPAVVWLQPLNGMPTLPFQPHGRYTLRQKNRTFLPHLQVVPIGAVVDFPNDDPFFHNVFSLFAGKRFDLGLYEAGSTKSVTFARQGASYIFCNIHPEMSAVILALPTSLFAIADSNDSFMLRDIPAGDYELHIWVEGVPQPILELRDRVVHLPPHSVDLGQITVPIPRVGSMDHTNKFGDSYNPEPRQSY
jgi:hypothetical protein